LAHEAHHHLVAATVLDREGNTGCKRHVTAHDPVTAEEVQVLVEQVHRTTLSSGDAVLPAIQLRHHRGAAHPAGKRLTGGAVGGDDVVIVAEDAYRAGGHSLLPDVQVAEPADLAERVSLCRALLETALEEHGPQQLEILLAIAGPGVAGRPLCGAPRAGRLAG